MNFSFLIAIFPVDVLLPMNMEIFFQNLVIVIFSVAIICIVFWYFVFAIIPLVAAFLIVLHFYRRGIRNLKRIENVTRSPWFSHISATAMGLSTIHAYEKTDDFIER